MRRRVAGVCVGVVPDQRALRLAVARGARHRVLVFARQALHGATPRRSSAWPWRWLRSGAGWPPAAAAGWEPWLLGLAIGLWVGGFDVLYACQDLEFDRAQGLRSIPVRFGVPASLSSLGRCTSAPSCAWRLWAGSCRSGRSIRPAWRRRGATGLRAVAGELRRSVPGETRVRSERLCGHRLLPGDGAGCLERPVLMQSSHVWRLALQDVSPGGAEQDNPAAGEVEPHPAPCSRRSLANPRQLYVG